MISSEIQIPGFGLKRLLSRGASAEVYLAEQISPKREVAIKLVALKAGLDETFPMPAEHGGPAQ